MPDLLTIPRGCETPWAETEALIACLDDNPDRARRLLAGFSRVELDELWEALDVFYGVLDSVDAAEVTR